MRPSNRPTKNLLSVTKIEITPKQSFASGTDSKEVYDRTGVLILQVYPFYDPIEYRENGERIQYASKSYYANFLDYNE